MCVFAPQTITHTFETISLFGKLGLQAPTDVSVFPDLIAALEAKKAEYAAAPAPPKAPKATHAAAAPSYAAHTRTHTMRARWRHCCRVCVPASASPLPCRFTVRRTAVNTPYGSGEVSGRGA